MVCVIIDLMDIHNIPSGRNFELIDQGEWHKGQGETVLGTRALGACTGIATFSRTTKTGHLLHEPLVASTGDLDNFFASVVEGAGDPKKIKVWVRGGSFESSLDDTGYNRRVEEARQMVIDKISELGLAKRQIDIEWAEENEIIDISIDCHNGKFKEDKMTFEKRENFED